MKYENVLLLVPLLGLTAAAPTPKAKPAYIIPRGVLAGREVPQEHSHNSFIATVNTNLKANNPANIEDAIFGLLGDSAAAAGAGSITNLECLHQATADQAFSNAKAAGDVDGQVAALIYQALERNTGAVGLKSLSCNETAVNPEIQAVQQHQDPASDGAAAGNKAIVLALAQQIAAVGGDPQDALQSGTFAPGQIGDPTAAGNTCDVVDDVEGCIFSENLIVFDATAEEITAAVAGISTSASASISTTPAVSASASASNETVAAVSSTTAVSACSAASSPAVAAVAASSTASSPTAVAGSSSLDFGSCTNPTIVFGAGFDGRDEDSFQPADESEFNHGSALNIGVISSFICGQLSSACKAGADAIAACTTAESAAATASGQAAADAFNEALGFSTSTKVRRAAACDNLQTFTGDLGGLPPPVTNSGDADRPFEVNGDTFVNLAAALQRSCSVQNTNCSNEANAGELGDTDVGDCNTQEAACNAAAA